MADTVSVYGIAKPIENSHQKRLMTLQGLYFKSEDTDANSIHCPVWSSLKNRGKLLGDCSRPWPLHHCCCHHHRSCFPPMTCLEGLAKTPKYPHPALAAYRALFGGLLCLKAYLRLVDRKGVSLAC